MLIAALLSSGRQQYDCLVDQPMQPKDRVSIDLRPVSVGLSWTWLRRTALLWEHPITSMVLALALYSALALLHGALWHTSAFAYYNYLAAALLHGQLHLT